MVECSTFGYFSVINISSSVFCTILAGHEEVKLLLVYGKIRHFVVGQGKLEIYQKTNRISLLK